MTNKNILKSFEALEEQEVKEILEELKGKEEEFSKQHSNTIYHINKEGKIETLQNLDYRTEEEIPPKVYLINKDGKIEVLQNLYYKPENTLDLSSIPKPEFYVTDSEKGEIKKLN